MSDLSSRVRGWLDAHIGELADDAPIAVHLDRLHALGAVDDLVGVSLAAFAALAARVAELGDPGCAGLVLPLRAAPASQVADAPASPASLARELLTSELPSLCLVTWRSVAKPEVSEERRSPLPYALAPAAGALPADRVLRAYYVEHRWPAAVAGGGVLERAVRVDAYPPGFV